MKRLPLLIAGAACTMGSACAGEGGFSYVMSLGWQDFRYEEKSSGLGLRSLARSGGPVLVAGGLYELANGHQFSLDNESTFYPGRGSEHWHSTGPVFGGVTLTDRELQRNGFSLRQSSTHIRGHYRLAEGWYASGGVALRTQSFKRYSFIIGPDSAVNLPAGATIEETTSEAVATLGGAYDSGPLRGQDVHYGFRATLGAPFWRRVENTSQPQALFSGIQGWEFSLEGRYSRAVIANVHLGVWGQWHQIVRRTQTLGSKLELPASTLRSWAGGLELLWKL